MEDKSAILSTYEKTGHLPPHDPERLDDFPPIRDFIRPKLKKKGYTAERLAEELGIGSSTVAKYFSGQTRDGNIHTIGPLCRKASFSLDEYFCIVAEDEAIKEERQHRLEDMELALDRMEQRHREERERDEERHRNDLHARRGLIYGLLALSAMLTLFCSLLLLRDGSDLTTGFIRSHGGVVGAIVFVVVLVLLLLLALWRILKIKRMTFGKNAL